MLPVEAGAFVSAQHEGRVLVVHLSSGSVIDGEASRFLEDERRVWPGIDVLDVLTEAPNTEDDAVAWGDQLGLGYPVAWDSVGSFGELWGRTTLYPTLLVLDGSGQVTARIHEQYESQLPSALE